MSTTSARYLVPALLLWFAADARAQPAAAQAEVLFDRGKALMAEGKTEDACAAFESSQKLAPAITTLLNHADCREKNGQLATAWGLFREAERVTRGSSTPGTRQLHGVAVDRAQRLSPRVSKLEVRVPPAHRVAGLEVGIGTARIEAGAWNSPLPIDGGSQTITARAPDRKPWTRTVTVKNERDLVVIEIPQLEHAERAPAVPAPTATSRSGRGPLPFLFGGLALALGGGAVGSELWGRARYEAAVDERDPERQEQLWRQANLRRYAAGGLGIAAVACLGVSIVLFARGGESTPVRTVSLHALGGGHGAAVRISW